jgi:hypothetical protein
MDDDLRASLESAFDIETAALDDPSDTPAPGPSEPATPSGADSAPNPPVKASEPATAPETAPGEKVRDALGRFVEKAGAPEAAPVAPVVPGAEAAVVPAAPAVTAPVAWGPSVREHWAALPPTVQQEIARREQAFTQAFREVAPQRELAQRFQQAVQPHMMAIQAEGVDPITAVTNLMQIGSRLRFGTPAEKAGTVAQIVKAYGVDIMALDGALVGAAPPPSNGIDPSTVQQLVQQQLQPLFQAAQQRQQAAVQSSYAQAAQEADAFAKTHEFYGDLRNTMADMIEVADRQGVNLSLADAYNRASMLHPDVSRVILARQQAASAKELTTAARKARGAAVSVRGGAPVGNPNASEPSSMRESIEAAIEMHSRI